MTQPRPRDLVTPDARSLRTALEGLTDTADPRALAAVRRSHPQAEPSLIAAVATQVRLERRGAGRLGSWARDMILEEEALQQATRQDVARYRAAQLAKRLGSAGAHIADIGCGLGVDARALAEAGFHVLAIEQDPWRAEAAELNLASLTAQVVCADATTLDRELLDSCAAAYIDPARRPLGGPRRTDGGRSRAMADPREWSPPWPWAVSLAERIAVVSKVAPGFDERHVPPHADIEWIDHDGETVEATVWMGSLGHGLRRATAVRGDRSESLEKTRASSQAGSPTSSDARDYLIEPLPAVLRAHVVDELAGGVGAVRLDGADWLTADEACDTLLARAWHVIAEVPHRAPELRAWLRGRGSVTWKTADTRSSAADWDRRVGHRPGGGDPVTVVITGHGRAFAVERATA